LKFMKSGRRILFLVLFLTAAMIPAAAWYSEEWIEGGENGFMINNVLIEVGPIGATTEDNNGTMKTTGNISLGIYEWKNDKWEPLKTGRLALDNSMNVKASDGEYTVDVLEIREIGRFNEVKLRIWTNATVTNSDKMKGGRLNATGSGKPELVITKVVTPASVPVDGIVTVQIFVNNKGQYDAKNVTITDPIPENFIVTNTTVDNTVNQTINMNTNNTYKVYQLKAVEPGTYTLKKATAVADNSVGVKYEYTSNEASISVEELPALIFSSAPLSGNTVDYQTRTKVDGSVTVKNVGTLPAQYVNIEFTLPPNATISGKNITVTGNKASMYIDQITPNNERIIEYSLTAEASGNYDVGITYQYDYNGGKKTGSVGTVAFRSVGNDAITTVLDYWFIGLIPILLIGIVVVFFIKKRNEYRF